jgi:hypothetical protein
MPNHPKRLLGVAITAAVLCAALGGEAAAQRVIVAPTSGVINSGGPGFGLLSHTFDQSGLSIGYTSGVTDFDAYMALNPMHTLLFSGFEWFSNSGTTSASVTYDLGSVFTLSRLALWNEESSGIGTLSLWYSLNGSDFFALALGLTPTDNPYGDYPAEIFAWGPTDMRYIRFDMSDCPQPNPGNFKACAIGEVAFASEVGVVPEPATISLVALGLIGLGAVNRRRNRKR